MKLSCHHFPLLQRNKVTQGKDAHEHIFLLALRHDEDYPVSFNVCSFYRNRRDETNRVARKGAQNLCTFYVNSYVVHMQPKICYHFRYH